MVAGKMLFGSVLLSISVFSSFLVSCAVGAPFGGGDDASGGALTSRAVSSVYTLTDKDVDVFIVAPLPVGYPITMSAQFCNDTLKAAQAEGKLSFGWRFDRERAVGDGCATPTFAGLVNTSCSLPLVQRIWMTPGLKNITLTVVDRTIHRTILQVPYTANIVAQLEPQNVVREEIHTFVQNTERWTQFYTSLQKIKDNGVYDNFVAIHLAAADYWLPNSDFSASAAHVGPAFLPWHRALLIHYERALQVAANDFTLGIPYWDWTIDQANGPASLLSIFNAQGLGTPKQRSVRKRIENSSHFYNGLEAGDVADGPFCTLSASKCSNGRTWPVHRDLDGPTLQRNMSVATVSADLPAAADMANLMRIKSYDVAPYVGVYSNSVVDVNKSFRVVLEGWTRPANWTSPGGNEFHNGVHVYIGGSMLPFTSPNDPIFFMHHANVDRLWEIWETQVCAPLGTGSDWCYKPSQPSEVPSTVPGAVCNEMGCTVAGQMIDSEMYPARVRVQQVLGPQPAYRWGRSAGFN